MRDYVLLSGATGLLGRYLTCDLLLSGHRLALLVRPSQQATEAQRVEEILQFWERRLGRSLPRPVVISGDVVQPLAGLGATERRWVASHCRRVIHSAAALSFFGFQRSDEPWRTNLGGTEQILALCRETGIRDLHYISTAYVCGQRTGHVLESELETPPLFRNHYEESKFLAEKLVRDARFLDQLTVYRPAVISGDSKTGYTNTYHGIYFYLRMMTVLLANVTPEPDGRRHTPLRVPLSGDEIRNIVPVDWVSAVISRLFNTPDAHGNTFHLAPSRPLRSREIVEFSYPYFNSYGVQFVGQGNSPSSDGLTDFEQKYTGNNLLYEIYETTDPTFDMTNLEKFAPDLPCPPICEATLRRYYSYAEKDRWGKRRDAKPVVPFWVGQFLQRLVADGRAATPHDGARDSRANSLEADFWFGLTFLGPGGGDWSLKLSPHGVASCEPGLRPACAGHLQIEVETFATLAADPILRVTAQPADLFQTNGSQIDWKLAARVFQCLLPEVPSHGEDQYASKRHAVIPPSRAFGPRTAISETPAAGR